MTRGAMITYPFGAGRRGLTLVDLVITMLVLGVMAAVAAPRFVHMMGRYRVEAAARRLGADVEYARRQAQARGRSQSVVFDVGAQSYELPDVVHPDRPQTPYVVELRNSGLGASLESAAFGSPAAARVRFDLYGRPEAGGTVVLAADGHQRTVRVDGTTGRITIE